MFVDRNGKIDENTKSEDIVKLIYRTMCDEIIQDLTKEISQEALNKMGEKEVLKFLIQQIRQLGIADISKRIQPNLNCKKEWTTTYNSTTLYMLCIIDDPEDFIEELGNEVKINLISAILGLLTEQEYKEIIKQFFHQSSEHIPIGIYKEIIDQLEKEERIKLLMKTLDNMSNNEYKNLLNVFYSGIGISIGKNFKDYLKEYPSDNSNIDNDIQQINNMEHEHIKGLLIKYGLDIIEYIKKVEQRISNDQTRSTTGNLDTNILFMIKNNNANLTEEEFSRSIDDDQKWMPKTTGPQYRLTG